MVDAARALEGVTGKLVQKLAAYEFDAASMQAVLNGLIKTGLSGEYVDYAAAEQVAMAMDSIVAAMANGGMLSDGKLRKLNAALDTVYKAVEKDEAYRPWRFTKALQDMQNAIKG